MHSPAGILTICADAKGVCAVRFGSCGGRMDETPLLLQAQGELEEYFAGRRSEFSVPLSIKGTPFQLRVWQELARIPRGETLSYGELARRMGRPGACRAVGMACRNNPVPVILPCHRVVGAKGGMTGYAGGLEIKKILLEIEGKHVEI